MMTFRSWGLSSWFLPHFNRDPWRFIGCISTEERSLTAWLEMQKHRRVISEVFATVEDPPSRYDELRNGLIADRVVQYREGGGTTQVAPIALHSSHEVIVSYLRRLIDTSPNLLIDISTFPKR